MIPCETGRADFDAFYRSISEDMQRAILALGAPVSLTDDLAFRLCGLAGLSAQQSKALVSAIHITDFVVERNSEWHLTLQVRRSLAQCLHRIPDTYIAAHTFLSKATSEFPLSPEASYPRYLGEKVGIAFHTTAIDPSSGLNLYIEAHEFILEGQQWLLGVLAIEQQEQGVIPPDAIEPAFLRGMTLHMEHRTREAEPYLRRVAGSEKRQHEVAIARHIVGLYDLRNEATQDRGEALLRSSLALGQALGRFIHEAHVLNSLGSYLSRDPDRQSEAESILQQGLEVSKSLADPSIRAQLLHSLGRLVSRRARRRGEAEELLKASLELLSIIGDQHGRAEVLHTLGLLRSRVPGRKAEAIRDLRESLRMLELENDGKGIAQVCFNLGRLVWETNPEEGRRLLQRSIDTNRKLGLRKGEELASRTLRHLSG